MKATIIRIAITTFCAAAACIFAIGASEIIINADLFETAAQIRTLGYSMFVLSGAMALAGVVALFVKA